MRAQFHALAFEGPDPYARAGGISSRIDDLVRAVAAEGFETHLWFVGDPALPGRERRDGVELHRWCQWISAHHPAGVYDGEEGKRLDFSRSLPPALVDDRLERFLLDGGRAVVLAEEWHTAEAVVQLDELLRRRGLRDRVAILWNANNLFGFDRIDWPALARAATVTTVSRYMKHRMAGLGIGAVAIPNGVADPAFEIPDPLDVARFRDEVAGRLVLVKMARYDPDKRWLATLDLVAEAKRRGLRPLLVARGGLEAHGAEVRARARSLGLSTGGRVLTSGGAEGIFEAVVPHAGIDVLDLRSHVDPRARGLLFHAADAVLSTSAHEPFGLVGLETMAVGGLAVTCCTGEEYADAGWNAIVVQADDPREVLEPLEALRADRGRLGALRREGRATALRYRWPEILRRHLFPRIGLVGGPDLARALLDPTAALEADPVGFRAAPRRRRASSPSRRRTVNR